MKTALSRYRVTKVFWRPRESPDIVRCQMSKKSGMGKWLEALLGMPDDADGFQRVLILKDQSRADERNCGCERQPFRKHVLWIA